MNFMKTVKRLNIKSARERERERERSAFLLFAKRSRRDKPEQEIY